MEYGSYEEAEARIQKALVALANESDLTVAAATSQFFVPDPRPREISKGRDSRMQQEGPGARLNKDPYRALEAYVRRYDSLRMPALIP